MPDPRLVQLAADRGYPMITCGHCGGRGDVPLPPELHRVWVVLTARPQTAQELHAAIFGNAAQRHPGCKSKVQTVAATLAQVHVLCALSLAALHPERRRRKGTRPAAQFTRAVPPPPPHEPRAMHCDDADYLPGVMPD